VVIFVGFRQQATRGEVAFGQHQATRHEMVSSSIPLQVSV